MARDATKRYVNEILEVSGVRASGLDGIDRLSDQEIGRLLDDLGHRISNHYRKNLSSILNDLQGMKKQPKAYSLAPWGGLHFSTEAPDLFVRKCALYYDKIVLHDLFEGFLSARKVERMTSAADKWFLRNALTSLHLLWPWITEGIIEIVPRPSRLRPIGDKIVQYAEKDSQDSAWQQQALRYEDRQVEGEAYLKLMEHAAEIWPPDMVAEWGGLRGFALRLARHGSSVAMGDGFFGSCLTDSSPTMDSRQEWRLFGYWVSRRAEAILANELGSDRWASFVKQARTGRAWLALDAEELSVLLKLPPAKIVEIRNSANYSFRYFREDLGQAVEEIEGLKLDDEKAYREAAKQVWSRVRENAREVKKDSEKIEKRIALETGAAVVSASLFLGLLPFGMAGLASALIGAPTILGLDTAKQFLDLRELKKTSGYFLVELHRSLEDAGELGLLA